MAVDFGTAGPNLTYNRIDLQSIALSVPGQRILAALARSITYSANSYDFPRQALGRFQEFSLFRDLPVGL
jgi:hypothetical protein